MAEDLPYMAEYAKSGRASCKGCKSKIDNAELRLAVMVQSPMFDGKTPNWYHFMCFFAKQRPKSVGDIDKFGTLRYEDQKRIQEKIESKLATGTTEEDLKDFATEYAKSSKSTCKGCNEKIAKGEVRISKNDYDSGYAKMRGAIPMWFHVDCFVQKRDDLDYTLGAESLPGFMTLGVDDQKMLKEKLKKLDRKRKPKEAGDTVDGPSSAKQPKKEVDVEEEKALKKQSDRVFKLRGDLQKNLSKKELQELLEFNSLDIPPGESRILDLLSDCMAFGVPARCPECKEGQLKLKTHGYTCTGNISGWTACTYVTLEPTRVPFKVPQDFKETYPFLNNYKSVTKKRIFPKDLPKPTEASTSANGSAGKQRPLDGLEVVFGKTVTPIEELKKKLTPLGAKVAAKVSEKTLCLISTAEEVKKKSKRVKEAEAFNVHVVSENFVDSLASGGAATNVDQFKLAPWGGDAGSKIEKYKSKSQMDRMFVKSGPSTMKLTVKGLAAVEPDSGLADIAHVYAKGDEIYSSVLGLVDVNRGTNSYYKLQLLESDKKNRYWVFRAWGRVGTSVGGNKVEEMDSLHEAKTHFKSLFEEKTGNLWEERKDFVKQPNRFYPLELDYGQDSVDKKQLKPSKDSKLHMSIQELICMIFDMNNFEKTMLEFEIDLTKMPLGKLSKRQIQKAYSVLTELAELIKSGGSDNQFTDASNRFYTLIPHDFGMSKPTLLKDDKLIEQKVNMLSSLLEIEVAVNLLKNEGDTEEDKLHPVDFHYSQLKADIQVLDRSHDEFSLLSKYVETTHAETHRSYKLEILELFKVVKDGEAKRYKPFRKLPNRKLLWHGSRLANFAGILSQGLRIAPPEAPVTGYMFGKGIYFADMVSKSANYCCTSPSNPVGLLLLCEVALGNMYERKNAEFITKLPPNYHSTKGVGMTYPNPENKVVTPDGVEVPMGPSLKDTKAGASSLLYNEYIVYDTAQVTMRYLMKVKFNYGI
ncbi:poly [ADP-ribose] polymerase 1 [Dermacentor silvarum]|uniref:poly [ADP-ribose] polymerase 1 n=1 Tax=Dermacentor silvarum TaxID=543639 RepID=UPI00189A9E36|nr:poly [ADP-ribose] polymerase 1 [Dermacentor silvarum]